MPRLLDLFCCAGGAAMGYHRAGFDVVGVDIEPQPNYPFEFHQADALTFPLDGFDAIHASPPCQAYTALRGRQGDRKYPDLVDETRKRLRAANVPFVIENVPGAPLDNPIQLCGSGFGLSVLRHRLFETNFPVMSPGCAHGGHAKKYRIRQHGREYPTAFAYVYGGGQSGQTAAEWRDAMGIDWMTVDELSQAIPPAYTEHIGGYLMQAVEQRMAA